ncbi:hypothetical protein [Streptomyces sp. NPDC058412]|uniref:hypothetical protein n=1 Tax=Streptomyces sp. NPDC058412 TaxID=3346486 RepID=UPI00365CA944
MAREPIPAAGPSVFLAGPTQDKRAPVPSWRPVALRALPEQWLGHRSLTVLSPESRHGERADTLPGMTTNVEFSLDVSTGRAVLGCPPDCPNPERNRYLIYVARRHCVPVCTTLTGTVAAALALVPAEDNPVAEQELLR